MNDGWTGCVTQFFVIFVLVAVVVFFTAKLEVIGEQLDVIEQAVTTQ